MEEAQEIAVVPRRKLTANQRVASVGIFYMMMTAPWTIAYFVVVGGTDQSVCSGLPLSFGRFARWGYLAATLYLPAALYTDYKIAVSHDSARFARLAMLNGCMLSIYTLFLFIIWIYACDALTHRDSCSSGLVMLIWATVLTPIMAIVLLCCGCVGVFLAATGKAYYDLKHLDDDETDETLLKN